MHRVYLATGDGTSITISFPLEERRDICNRRDTQQRTKSKDTNINLIRFKLVKEMNTH